MKLNNAIKMAMIITTYSSIFPVTAWDYTMFLPQDQQQQDVIEEDQPTTTTPPIISIRAIDDIATCIASTTVEIDVLSNDIADPNAMPLTITETSNNGRNGACFNLNQYIRYLPVSGFTGTDECVYTVCDSLGGCDSATLTIIVTSSLDGSFATSPTNDNNAQNSPDSFTEYQPAIAIPETEIHDDDNDSRYNDDDDGGGQPLNSNDVALFLNNCPTGEVKITIELQTDQYGDDTTFELMKEENDDSTVVLSRGPYGFNSFDVVQICAPSPSIYTFIIYDKYGDG